MIINESLPEKDTPERLVSIRFRPFPSIRLRPEANIQIIACDAATTAGHQAGPYKVCD
jgi:hypothetical protein